MSVAIYLPHLRCGGAEVSVVRLAEGLAAKGVKTRLVIHRADPHAANVLRPSVEVVELAAGRTVAALPQLVRFLRKSRPGMLLAALTHNNLVAVAAGALSGTRVVVSEHAPVTQQLDQHVGWRYSILPRLLPPIYARAHAVVAVSQGVADDLTRLGCRHRRLAVIPNPVLPTGWEKLAEACPDDDWFAPGQPPVIVAAGRLAPEKDFATLLAAFLLVRQRRPETRLMILGEGPERPALTQLAKQLGVAEAVRLAGFVANPFAIMRRAAAFALSSRYEGFGNVLVEALACGAPVVATDCPVGPREILEGGRWGKLVPVGSAEAMAGALLAVLADGGPSLGRRRHAEGYSAEASVEAYMRLFANG